MKRRFGGSFVLWALLSVIALGVAGVFCSEWQKHAAYRDELLADGNSAAAELLRLEYDKSGNAVDGDKYDHLMSRMRQAKDAGDFTAIMQQELAIMLVALAASGLCAFLAFRSTRPTAASPSTNDSRGLR